MSGVSRQGLWEAWQAECLPADGGRVSRLRYDGQNLLTRAPDAFRPPRADYGRYETRPVYGYDDCMPSVEAGARRSWSIRWEVSCR